MNTKFDPFKVSELVRDVYPLSAFGWRKREDRNSIKLGARIDTQHAYASIEVDDSKLAEGYTEEAAAFDLLRKMGATK